ncbi:MAG: hypothetical protein KAQ65_03465 [Candidatus Thorarchaeota archaeon]|nr:hypothetical protein [Candidatus Thorarchaeota archaeon]MCK5240155.1 hypothetical protein [Candidatus Thorarchaeota archaeon]
MASQKTYEYARRLQLKHFFDDRDTGAKRRTWFEVQLSEPTKTTEGWVNDGRIRVSIGEDRDIKGSFLLNIEEASRLVKTLELAIEDHERNKADLWRS